MEQSLIILSARAASSTKMKLMQLFKIILRPWVSKSGSLLIFKRLKSHQPQWLTTQKQANAKWTLSYPVSTEREEWWVSSITRLGPISFENTTKNFNSGTKKERNLKWRHASQLRRDWHALIKWCRRSRMVTANHFCTAQLWITTQLTWPRSWALLIYLRILKSM